MHTNKRERLAGDVSAPEQPGPSPAAIARRVPPDAPVVGDRMELCGEIVETAPGGRGGGGRSAAAAAVIDVGAIAAARGVSALDALRWVRRAGCLSLFQVIHEEAIATPRSVRERGAEAFQAEFLRWQHPQTHVHMEGERTRIAPLPRPSPPRAHVDVRGIAEHTFTVVMWPTDARPALRRRLAQYLAFTEQLHALPALLLLLPERYEYYSGVLDCLAVARLLGGAPAGPPPFAPGPVWGPPLARAGAFACWRAPDADADGGLIVGYDDGDGNRTEPLVFGAGGPRNLPRDAAALADLLRRVPAAALAAAAGPLAPLQLADGAGDAPGLQRALDALHGSRAPGARVALRINLGRLPRRPADGPHGPPAADGTTVPVRSCRGEIVRDLAVLLAPVGGAAGPTPPLRWARDPEDPAPERAGVDAAHCRGPIRLGWRQTEVDPSDVGYAAAAPGLADPRTAWELVGRCRLPGLVPFPAALHPDEVAALPHPAAFFDAAIAAGDGRLCACRTAVLGDGSFTLGFLYPGASRAAVRATARALLYRYVPDYEPFSLLPLLPLSAKADIGTHILAPLRLARIVGEEEAGTEADVTLPVRTADESGVSYRIDRLHGVGPIVYCDAPDDWAPAGLLSRVGARNLPRDADTILRLLRVRKEDGEVDGTLCPDGRRIQAYLDAAHAAAGPDPADPLAALAPERPAQLSAALALKFNASHAVYVGSDGGSLPPLRPETEARMVGFAARMAAMSVASELTEP